MRIRPHPTIVKKTRYDNEEYQKYVCATNITNKRLEARQAVWRKSKYHKYTIQHQLWTNVVKSAGSNIVRTKYP